VLDVALESRKLDRITGISSMAMRHVLAELGDAYEQKSGQPISVVSAGGVDAARRVAEGEAFDFVVLAVDAIEQLAAGGRVDPGSRTDLARSAVAIAVAAGATRPDVSTESAIRDAVLSARSIGYSTGPSGAHLVRLFERWGIADAIAPRILQAPPGIPVGTLVARGDVELGFQQLSELMHLPGIDVVGPLPAEIQVETVFSAAVCTASNCPAAAKGWLSFLASPEGDAAKRRHGMEPA
jgi:molybdate transport system substrate-binding protein